jgi:hypothetical protein
LPYRRPMPFAINNCSLNVFDVSVREDGERHSVLLNLNDVCHLVE